MTDLEGVRQKIREARRWAEEAYDAHQQAPEEPESPAMGRAILAINDLATAVDRLTDALAKPES